MSSDIILKEVKSFERLTQNARKTINRAYKIAEDYFHPEFLGLHLIIAILENRFGILEDLFQKIGLDVEETLKGLRSQLIKISEAPMSPSGHKPVFSEEIKKIINDAFTVSGELDQVFVGTEHLLLSLFKLKEHFYIKDFSKFGVSYESLKKLVKELGDYTFISQLAPFGSEEDEETNQQLPPFIKDMSQFAIDGKYPNITGRDKEIKRMTQILARRTKNNPILVGDAGVGKTAIVEGFVNKLVASDLPASMFQKRVLSLDVGAIIAGARLRGDVEERINYVIQMAADDGNVILFIDEIHNIIGAGSGGGRETLDIANILKPHLTNPDLTVIGATTIDEYQKYFENDAALSRRFQPIFVDELDSESATQVIKTLRHDFESYHNVKISDQAIESAVKLSSQFIKDRYLPDKAIDLIDEAAASVKIGREIAIEPELADLGKKLLGVQKKKEMALNQGDMKSAAKYKKDETAVVDEISNIIEGRKSVKKKYLKNVNEELIRQIIVDWTKIPIAASDISDKKLKELENKLKERIIGQDHVVEKATLAIQRSHLGLGSDKRPLSSFLFLGPTGVGKTELAKMLAKELFGSDDLLFRVDMSEMMEMHSVAKLIGAPPGYIGYQEGGQLTKFVRRKPYSVILFDEIEKAHPDTLNILLQILEEGELTDGQGRKISFSNTIIVMTSNIGAEKVSADNRLGFDINIDDKESEEMEEAFEEMRDRILEELKDSVSPEFMNRIDHIDVFRGLNMEDTLKITKLQVNDLKLRLLEKGLLLEVSDSVVKSVNKSGYSTEFGGRNIRRKIQEVIENGLATFLLDNKIPMKRKDLIKISVTMKKDKIIFQLN